MMVASSNPMESRHRVSIPTDETSKRRCQNENGVHGYRYWNREFSTLKVVLILITMVALFTFYHSPPLQIVEDRSGFVNKRILESGVATDPRYLSTAEINWNHMSNVVERYLFGRSAYRGIGFLNLNDNEVYRWKEVMKSESQHIALHLDHAANNITWESLYPEWIDEEEEFEVPTCPSLPWIQVPSKPRIDLVVTKLPCNKSGKWSRDVARLHLQLAAARVASSSKGLHDIHVILISDCFPIPNLFTGQELVTRQGNIWLYKPNLNQLRKRLLLPIGSCELSVPLQAKDRFYSSNAKKEAYATILHSAQDYFASDEAHRTWWRVHDGMSENLQRFCLLRSKQKAQLEWDRRQAEKGSYVDGHWKIKIQDKRLQICFEKFCFWESMLLHWGETKNITSDSSSVSSMSRKTAAKFSM
ncbi:hypothetical protein AALP_AA2G212800 [Arabis alpina]|uniref:Hexosyltransferase n=1 Tax=Arabis alpina TaxID=50452 RepID=A0A087HJ13_ARAAL|nr:hypothetical protein AALP_AA2G212800 [Arabis alpina]